MPGNLYISSLVVEQNAYELLSYKLDDILTMHTVGSNGSDIFITNQSSSDYLKGLIISKLRIYQNAALRSQIFAEKVQFFYC